MKYPWFVHFRNPDSMSRGGVTVCVSRDDLTGTYVVTATACSPKDNFNRKAGRRIAEGRQSHKKAERWRFVEEPDIHTPKQASHQDSDGCLQMCLASLHSIAQEKWTRACRRSETAPSVITLLPKRVAREPFWETIADA